MHAFYVDALPILNESGKVVTPVVAKPTSFNRNASTNGRKNNFIIYGPLTDLARALYETPIIEDKIERVSFGWVVHFLKLAMYMNQSMMEQLSGIRFGTLKRWLVYGMQN